MGPQEPLIPPPPHRVFTGVRHKAQHLPHLEEEALGLGDHPGHSSWHLGHYTLGHPPQGPQAASYTLQGLREHVSGDKASGWGGEWGWRRVQPGPRTGVCKACEAYLA